MPPVAEPVYGLMAEFEHDHEMLDAIRRLRAEGYTRIEAYTPHPVEGLSEALGLRRSPMPLMVLIAALAGAAGGFGLQYYVSVIDWPLNVGGRPLNSWPMFIPVTFEVAILLSALTAFFGMLALNGFPRPYHQVFNVPRFGLASRNRFFVVVRTEDERFDPEATQRLLESFEPQGVSEVAA